jgi:alkylation response protein AidB-like acyl-CoA dehydrogenase
LVPLIVDRADDIERNRAMPRELIDGLRSAGVFRMYVPRSHGGDEFSTVDAIAVIEELRRADGSVGWIATIGANSPALLCRWPPATYDEIYRRGPGCDPRRQPLPRGQAGRHRRRIRFSGQWPFASGCEHADVITSTRSSSIRRVGSSERPDAVDASCRGSRDQVKILDTWHVSGLRGNGSHDIAGRGSFRRRRVDRQHRRAAAGCSHPLDTLPLLGRLGLELAACAVGIGQGAIDDVVDIAQTKRSLGGCWVRVAEDPVFQYKLGRLELDLRTARILVQHIARLDGEYASRVDPPSQGELLQRRTLLGRIAELTAAVVDGAYAACGTTGLYTSSPLQRRLRDIRALTQHIMFAYNAYTPRRRATTRRTRQHRSALSYACSARHFVHDDQVDELGAPSNISAIVALAACSPSSRRGSFSRARAFSSLSKTTIM